MNSRNKFDSRTTRMTSALAAILLGVGFLFAGSAKAALYDFTGTVTLCTGTCDSFASLDVGTQLTGRWEINTSPDGSWSFADMGNFEAFLTNLGTPLEPYNGTNLTTSNPLPLSPAVAPIAASGGGLTTGGTTDVFNELNSGIILHEFVVAPFNNNGAWLIFDIGVGGAAQAQICLFFPTAGCIPGATQAVVIDGQFNVIPIPASVWLFSSALIGLIGLKRNL